MNIKRNQTDGCDKMSRIYEDMYNVLQDVMRDEDKLKELSLLDYSALGMYIGKFVEQEINSSVVQIMRAFRGVKMPDYYCRFFDKRDKRIYPVETRRKSIYLNSYKSVGEQALLKTIPLGDAYSALEVLKTEDRSHFFDQYPWLNDQDFLDAWHELANYRNMMAHIGEIIDADILKKNYELFLQFLKFMPDITMAKMELAPEGYIEELPQPKKKEEKPQIIVSTDDNDDYRYVAEPFGEDDTILMDGLPGMGRMIPKYYIDNFDNYQKKINTKNKIFEGNNGKKGLKVSGKTIVPSNYDGFGFLPKTIKSKYKSIIAVREGSYVLVALDGSGKELTEETYDEIRLANEDVENSPYLFRKHGFHSWGIMNQEGETICKNMIDAYICDADSMLYESGELRGYWKYSKGYPFLSPIFDDIEMPENPGDPILFVLNGVEGHVKLFEDEYEFISKVELEKFDEKDRNNTLKCCISEE